MVAPRLVRAACLAALVTPSFSLPSVAVTIRVPADQPTIQAGIDVASAGDTVLVAPGTYAGLGNRDLSFGGTDLVLRSSDGPAATIIDCQTQGRGLLFQNGETAASVVEGFTIRNGLASGAYGGGILIEAGATPTVRECRFVTNQANTGGAVYVLSSGLTLEDCDFERNSADNYGGALYAYNSSLELGGCTFEENQAGFGAAMYLWQSSNATLQDCDFSGNAALNLAGAIFGGRSMLTIDRSDFAANSGKEGGAIYCVENASATLDSCTFALNTADFYGGAFYGDQMSMASLTWCTFDRNKTTRDNAEFTGGGGVYLHCESPAGTLITMTDCTFVANRATGAHAEGGGALLRLAQAPPATIERCTFLNNEADVYGGGLEVGGSAQSVRDCMFVDNRCGASGGGAFGLQGLYGCTFEGNVAGQDGGGAYTMSPLIVDGCSFIDNAASNEGGGAYCFLPYLWEFVQCTFEGNSAASGGAVHVRTTASGSLTGCTFEGNAAFDGGAARIAFRANPGPVTFSSCTFGANAGTYGSSLALDVPIDVDHSILAFGTSSGAAIECFQTGIAALSCTDIYGNAGGDWTECISEQLGINGNFSADPLFCNMGAGDYTLAETSPCAPEHSPAGCGLIGAFPVACVDPIGVAGEGAPPVAGWLRATPNPMRSDGLIEWVSEAAAPVSLRLYDPLGRLVTSRSLGLLPAGRQELRWDGLVRDRRLPPGVYLLELGGPMGGVDQARVIVMR